MCQPQRSRYLVETPAVTSSVGMHEQPTGASKRAFDWFPLALLLIACFAFVAWSAAQTRPAPAIKRAPAQAPAKQLPKQRTNPSGEPEPYC